MLAVLETLLRHGLHASPSHHMQQPALACLVALAEQQPCVADWLLADADARVVPLLPLAFHPLAVVRRATAELLHYLLFSAATRQLQSLAAHAAGWEAHSAPGGAALQQEAVPEPFCACYRFARPAAVAPVAAALHPSPPPSIFGSEAQQRLWRARQLCNAAAHGGAGSAGGLLQLLASPAMPAAPARWEADLIRSSLAMLRGLQPEALIADALHQLAACEDHQQCHAALCRVKLLVAALPEVRGHALRVTFVCVPTALHSVLD